MHFYPGTAGDLEAKLCVVLKYADALREKGLTKLSICGIELELKAQPIESPPPPQHEQGASRDPVTYGLPAGTPLPRLRKE